MIEQPAAKILLQVGDRRVGLDVQDPENTRRPALFCQQRHFVLHRLPRVVHGDGRSVQRQAAFLARGQAEDRLQKLGAPRTVQAGDADDLALVGFKAHMV